MRDEIEKLAIAVYSLNRKNLPEKEAIRIEKQLLGLAPDF
jgi:hypothetical protein